MNALLKRLLPASLVVRAARERARRQAGMVRREVVLASGRRVVVLDSGGEGPPLVMVHGIGASKDHWTALGAELHGRFRLVAPDLPGFGESDTPDVEAEPEAYAMPAQAEAVLGLADALGLGAFHLAGSSMGGRIAAELAARHPDRVRTLWLLDPAGAEGERPSEMIEGLFAGRGVPLFARTPEEYAAVIAFSMRKPPFIPSFALRVLAAESAAAYARNLQVFAQMSMEFATGPTTEAILRGLPIPTLISWGAEDRVLHPSGAATIAAGLPDATVRVMPGIGHLPMVEDPEAAAADVLAFVDAHTLAVSGPPPAA